MSKYYRITNGGGVKIKLPYSTGMEVSGDHIQVSDGYHTMDELYAHRIALFVALVRQMGGGGNPAELPWKSKKHSDGSEIEGWFVLGIGRSQGNQITYHLPLMHWDAINVDILEQAPPYDGHTPDDVLKRLWKLGVVPFPQSPHGELVIDKESKR